MIRMMSAPVKEPSVSEMAKDLKPRSEEPGPHPPSFRPGQSTNDFRPSWTMRSHERKRVRSTGSSNGVDHASKALEQYLHRCCQMLKYELTKVKRHTLNRKQ